MSAVVVVYNIGFTLFNTPFLHLQISSSPWSWSWSWQLWSQWWESGTCWDYTWACLSVWWTQLRETITPPLRGRRVWFRSGCRFHSSAPPGAPWWRLSIKWVWNLPQKRSQRSAVSEKWTCFARTRAFIRRSKSWWNNYDCQYSEVCMTKYMYVRTLFVLWSNSSKLRLQDLYLREWEDSLCRDGVDAQYMEYLSSLYSFCIIEFYK